jgi:hypothetical protein
MSVTHTYVVSSATGLGGVATITGTVDNIPSTGPIPVTIQISLGDVLAINGSGGLAALEAFVAPLMLKAAIAAGLSVPAPVPIAQLPTGTFTQGGHTYTVSSVTGIGDVATIVGSVDGTAITVTSSVSELSAFLAQGLLQLENYAASLMLPAAVKAGLAPPTVTQLPTGTFVL